jgi:hypothetical protein
MAGTVPIHLTTRRLRLCMADLRGGRLFLGCGGLRGGFGVAGGLRTCDCSFVRLQLCHAENFPTGQNQFPVAALNASFQKGTACRLAGRYDQKALKLACTKIFSSCVTKVAVLKVAIEKPEFDLVGLTVIY